LREGEILSDSPIFVNREYFESIPRSHIKAGYFLFSIMASIGNVAVVPDNFPDCTANRAVGILIPRDIERLDANYLLALFGSNLGINLLEKLTRGGIQKRTNLGDIEKLKIPLPPLEIQRSLVAEIEAARQTRKQKLSQADELLSNLNECFVEILGFAHSPQPESTKVRCFAVKRAKMEPRLDCQFYFAEHYTLAEDLKKTGFPVFKLGNSKISQSVVDGPFGSQLKVEEYQKVGIPLIRVSNCRSGKIFDDGDWVYISEEKHQQLIRSEVLPGDVLLTKAGHILGYAAVFPEDFEKGNITSHLASIRPSEDIIPEFLAAYLRSYWGNVQIYRWGNKATRPELNTDEVRQILVPLPPKDIQRSLVLEIEKRRADAQRLRQEAETEWKAAKTRFEHKLLGEEA
jgi:restriction endonuclease S subunit